MPGADGRVLAALLLDFLNQLLGHLVDDTVNVSAALGGGDTVDEGHLAGSRGTKRESHLPAFVDHLVYKLQGLARVVGGALRVQFAVVFEAFYLVPTNTIHNL